MKIKERKKDRRVTAGRTVHSSRFDADLDCGRSLCGAYSGLGYGGGGGFRGRGCLLRWGLS